MKKSKTPCQLESLTEDQQAQVAEWLLGGMSYHKAAEKVKAEFGLDVWPQRFTRFWNEVCAPALGARRARIAYAASHINGIALKDPVPFDPATLDMLAQRTLEALIAPATDAKTIKSLYALVLKHNDQEIRKKQLDLELRRVEILERKAKLAEQAEQTTKDPTLTAEERQARYREIFGITA